MRQEPANHETGKRSPKALAPSVANARNILRKAAFRGNVTFTNRFLDRCRMHVINTVDVVRVLSTGVLVGTSQFDSANDGWRYQVVGLAEGRKLKIEVLLDCQQDWDESPLVTVVSACWWRGRARAQKE